MVAFVFDSHAFIKRLKATGFTEEQAEAIVDVGREHLQQLATKGDLKAEISALKTELVATELRITLKAGAMLAAAVGILLTALKLWH